MKKIPFFILPALLLLSVAGCRQRRDAAYYERMVDSIRKAETVSELQQQAGIHSDPVVAFFDTLSLVPLPLESEGADLYRLGHFSRAPYAVCQWLGFPPEVRLSALMLPTHKDHRVVLLAEQSDSLAPMLYLQTLTRQYKPVDQMCIYEERPDDRLDDTGKTLMDYFITSDYAVTLMQYFVPSHSGKRQLESTRRFVITPDGRFEEEVIEF